MYSSDMPSAITTADISDAIHSLRIADRPVCVHSSLQSFGYVEGGADAGVDGVLKACGTMMVPSFSWSYAIMPPTDQQYPQNGCDYADYSETTSGWDKIYSPESQTIDAKMGAIPRAVVTREGRRRGFHAVCSFSALGPVANDLIAGQRPDDVYAPLSELARRDGAVILMGVGLQRLTLLHLAEKLAGRTLLRRWALGPSGEPIAHEAGGCSAGFSNLGPVLSPLMRRSTVGASNWICMPVRETLEAVAEAIRKDPRITHCGDPDCLKCRDAMLGGPRVP